MLDMTQAALLGTLHTHTFPNARRNRAPAREAWRAPNSTDVWLRSTPLSDSVIDHIQYHGDVRPDEKAFLLPILCPNRNNREHT